MLSWWLEVGHTLEENWVYPIYLTLEYQVISITGQTVDHRLKQRLRRDCWYSEPSLISISPVHLTSLPFRLRKTKQCHDIEGEGEGKLGNQMCSIETLTCWKVWAAIHQRLYATCAWEKPLVCTKIQIYITTTLYSTQSNI